MIGINISTADSGGDFNPKLQGELVYGVYCFCKIANYKILCTLLGERMITFVNEIAEIIHTQVDLHQGVPNRNFGDDFIIIWKVPEYVDQKNEDEMALMPDISVLTMMKIYGKINAYQHIRRYRNNEALKAAIPGFNPTVKFGIHFGESIEGCIGSQWKIDSAYISLHVIVAKQLAAATYSYGVKVLISGEVVDRMSESFRDKMKIIDVVNVNGTDKPLELYTMSIEEEEVMEEVDPYAHLDPEKNESDDKKKEEK